MKYPITFIDSRSFSHSTGVWHKGADRWGTLGTTCHSIAACMSGPLMCISFLSIHDVTCSFLLDVRKFFIYLSSHMLSTLALSSGCASPIFVPNLSFAICFFYLFFVKKRIGCINHFFITSWFWIIARNPFSGPHHRESIMFSSTCIASRFCSLMYWKFFFFFYFQHEEWELFFKCWTNCLFLVCLPHLESMHLGIALDYFK